MNIRHKRDKNRVIADVTMDVNKSHWFKIINDVVQQYPVKFWEPADVDSWTPVVVEVGDMGKSVKYGGSHVAAILNSNDFKFSLNGNTLQVEMRS